MSATVFFAEDARSRTILVMDPDHYILIVEDDLELRDALADLLQGYGYRTSQAGNGAEALDILQQRSSPCLVLLDLMMPVMTGQELLARIDADAIAPQPDVLIMTEAQSGPTLAGTDRPAQAPERREAHVGDRPALLLSAS
jgi:CheY-like chemotaxis protein